MSQINELLLTIFKEVEGGKGGGGEGRRVGDLWFSIFYHVSWQLVSFCLCFREAVFKDCDIDEVKKKCQETVSEWILIVDLK